MKQNDYNYSLILVPLLFGLAALLLRLFHLDDKSIWMDEAFTAYHSTFSALELWTQPVTNKPPLYYLMTSLFWSPGDSVTALRLPVAFLGAISVILAWYLGYALAQHRGAFLLALFTLLSDVNLLYSQEARHYILLAVGWQLLLLSLLRLLKSCPVYDKPRPSDLLWLAVGVVLMVNAHPIALHYLVATGIAYLLVVMTQQGHRRHYVVQPLALALLAALTVVPWIPAGMMDASTNFNWLKQPGAARALFEYLVLFGSGNLVFLSGKKVALGIGLALAILSFAGLIHWSLRQNRQHGVLLLSVLVVTPLLIWITGLVKPVYMVRTLMPLHLVAMTGLALAVSVIKPLSLRVVSTSVLSVILAVSSYGYFTYYQKEDWAGLAGHLRDNASANAVVLVCEAYLIHPLGFYLNEQTPAVIDLNHNKRRIRIKDAITQPWRPYSIWAGDKLPETIHVIGRFGRCAKPMQRDLMRMTGFHYQPVQEWSGYKIRLVSYQREGVDSRFSY